MTEYEVYKMARARLESVWREAERNARLLAAAGEFSVDSETATSRSAGGRV
jgi:hypothetical protein